MVCVWMRCLEDVQRLVEEVSDQVMDEVYNVLRVLQSEDLPLTEELPPGDWK